MAIPFKAPWLTIPFPSHSNGFIPGGIRLVRPDHAATLRERKAAKRRSRRSSR
jgi:hypothetical protein